MKTTGHKQFFTLLKAGLWKQQADATLFESGVEWLSIFTLAKSQSLLGIIFDGMHTLPEACMPERKIYLQWCSLVGKIEQSNSKLNAELKNIFSLYTLHGLTPVLLKGQGVAQNYPNPFHRQCGDIDVYLGSKQYREANKLILKDGGVENLEESNKHSGFQWHQIEVENHRIAASLSAPRANAYFQQLIKSWFPNGRTVTIDGFSTTVPPAEFDALFLLIHAVIHFLSGGIGLRQVCDWACLLHARQAELKHTEVAESYRRTGLTRAGKAFGYIAVEYLGLPLEELPFELGEKDKERGEWLLNDILQTGNFGQFDRRRKIKPKGYWSGKWYTFTKIINRCRELGEFAPGEARWYPFMLAMHSAKMQIKHRLS